MSSPRFPLYNIRKDHFGVWQQGHETGESVTVPSSASSYCVRLKEVPDNGTVNSKPEVIKEEVSPTNMKVKAYLTGDNKKEIVEKEIVEDKKRAKTQKYGIEKQTFINL